MALEAAFARSAAAQRGLGEQCRDAEPRWRSSLRAAEGLRQEVEALRGALERNVTAMGVLVEKMMELWGGGVGGGRGGGEERAGDRDGGGGSGGGARAGGALPPPRVTRARAPFPASSLAQAANATAALNGNGDEGAARPRKSPFERYAEKEEEQGGG